MHCTEKDGIGAGESYYSSEEDSSVPTGPAFKQYCVPIPLAPGAEQILLLCFNAQRRQLRP